MDAVWVVQAVDRLDCHRDSRRNCSRGVRGVLFLQTIIVAAPLLMACALWFDTDRVGAYPDDRAGAERGPAGV